MGINPEAEPAPAEMARLVHLMQERGIRYVAFETLVSPKVAETLAKSTGAQTYVLNPLEGLTKEERARGEDFVTVMARNIRSLKTALNE
jgi:zinc transport system substrate-binding protein